MGVGCGLVVLLILGVWFLGWYYQFMFYWAAPVISVVAGFNVAHLNGSTKTCLGDFGAIVTLVELVIGLVWMVGFPLVLVLLVFTLFSDEKEEMIRRVLGLLVIAITAFFLFGFILRMVKPYACIN